MAQQRTWQIAVSVVGACIVGYFLYHTIEGERGWIAEIRLQNEARDAESKLTKLKQEREAVERRVKLMRPERMDPDLLDEEARKSLNYSKPNEIIILTPPQKETADPKP